MSKLIRQIEWEREKQGLHYDLFTDVSDQITYHLDLSEAHLNYLVDSGSRVRAGEYTLRVKSVVTPRGWIKAWFVDQWDTVERGTASFQLIPDGGELSQLFTELKKAELCNERK